MERKAADMRMAKIVWLCIFPIFLLTGCWDKLELEGQAYVVALGLDKASDNLLSVTFQIANPQVGSTVKGEATNEPPSDFVSFVVPDIISAKELANSVISRRINFGHLRTIIVGENLAVTGEFQHIIGTSLRDPEMRREINLIVSQENASEFIQNNKPKMETRPHKYYSFMTQRWRETGEVPYSTLNRYYSRVEGELFLAIYATTKKHGQRESPNEDNYLAGEVPQKGGDPVQMIGSAVFKNGRMISKLTGEETRYALVLRRRALARSIVASYTDPLNSKYRFTVRMVRRGNTRIKVDVKQDPLVVNVNVPLICQVLSIPSLIDYPKDTHKQKVLKASLEEIMQSKAMQLVQKTQRQYQAEPFLWYNQARVKFWTLREFEAYHWGDRFSRAKVNVDFDIRMEMFGKQLDPARPQQQTRG
jgi:spore germination protein KC